MTATSAVSHHGSRLALLGIVTIGAVLRFWALDHGVPFALGPDEHFVLERALRIVRTGDFHPHFFDYPTLYIYVQSLVIVVRFLAGAAAGLWSTLDAAPASEFYLWGRVMTASIGAATIALAWSIARRSLECRPMWIPCCRQAGASSSTIVPRTRIGTRRRRPSTRQMGRPSTPRRMPCATIGCA